MAVLDQGEGAGRDVCLVGKVFLGRASLFAGLADRLAEGGLGLVGAAHYAETFSSASVMSQGTK